MKWENVLKQWQFQLVKCKIISLYFSSFVLTNRFSRNVYLLSLGILLWWSYLDQPFSKHLSFWNLFGRIFGTRFSLTFISTSYHYILFISLTFISISYHYILFISEKYFAQCIWEQTMATERVPWKRQTCRHLNSYYTRSSNVSRLLVQVENAHHSRSDGRKTYCTTT